MKPQIYHVDAFTGDPFRGNSAGVVLHADTLSDAQMQLIARELRHSETAFLLKSEESDVRIRYFTPTVEVPICGHATVAAHYVRATVLGLGNTTVWQTSLAGRHRVEIGIVEDPVTGNANGPMGAWLVHHGLMAHDGKTLQIQGHQGRALGKEGTVDVTVTIRDNQPENVTISGQAVILFHAEWAITF
ncbi:PhzF family phenazine biosynthesis isomerase [Salmonella enterica]